MARNEKYGLYDTTHRHSCEVFGCSKPSVAYLGRGDIIHERYHLCEEHKKELIDDILEKHTEVVEEIVEVEEVVTEEELTLEQLNKLTKKELQAIADDLSVEYNSKTTNDDLVKAITEAGEQDES